MNKETNVEQIQNKEIYFFLPQICTEKLQLQVESALQYWNATKICPPQKRHNSPSGLRDFPATKKLACVAGGIVWVRD